MQRNPQMERPHPLEKEPNKRKRRKVLSISFLSYSFSMTDILWSGLVWWVFRFFFEDEVGVPPAPPSPEHKTRNPSPAGSIKRKMPLVDELNVAQSSDLRRAPHLPHLLPSARSSLVVSHRMHAGLVKEASRRILSREFRTSQLRFNKNDIRRKVETGLTSLPPACRWQAGRKN